MKGKIEEVIDQLLKHEINKKEAIQELSILQVTILPPNVKKALNASVSAIYFADNSDYRSFHYEVVTSLANIKEPTEKDIKALFYQLNPECDDNKDTI